MRSRRRIFQRSFPFRLGPAPIVLFLVVAIGGVGALLLGGLPGGFFGGQAEPPAHVAADAGAVAVIGGDTLRLEGQVVRLRGVEAPDRGDRCSGDRDCGGAATSALAGLVRGRRVECAVTGRDGTGRPYAACEANGTDLSRAIVASGWARATPGAPELADLELRARRQRYGLWADAGAH